jgi:hypothetical protein
MADPASQLVAMRRWRLGAADVRDDLGEEVSLAELFKDYDDVGGEGMALMASVDADCTDWQPVYIKLIEPPESERGGSDGSSDALADAAPRWWLVTDAAGRAIDSLEAGISGHGISQASLMERCLRFRPATEEEAAEVEVEEEEEEEVKKEEGDAADADDDDEKAPELEYITHGTRVEFTDKDGVHSGTVRANYPISPARCSRLLTHLLTSHLPSPPPIPAAVQEGGARQQGRAHPRCHKPVAGLQGGGRHRGAQTTQARDQRPEGGQGGGLA